MKKISLQEFMEDWERGIIHDVQSAGNRLYGKSARGQTADFRGYTLVYADATEPVKKPWWKFWLRG